MKHVSDKTLMINEVFYSIQGESTWAGLPCVFIRLMGCDLRCNYCDTEYAFFEGQRRAIDEILDEAFHFSEGHCELFEITGGEPLLQPGVHDLIAALLEHGKTVLLETSGAHEISLVDPRAIRIVDFKTPTSGEAERNRWENIDALQPHDEVKFVLCDRGDYEWMRDVLEKYDLAKRVNAVLVSPVAAIEAGPQIPGTPPLPLRDVAQWILEDSLPVRLQTQLHKQIWHPSTRGV